eukprot:6455550-Amphidinium_carterae.2
MYASVMDAQDNNVRHTHMVNPTLLECVLLALEGVRYATRRSASNGYSNPSSVATGPLIATSSGASFF